MSLWAWFHNWTKHHSTSSTTFWHIYPGEYTCVYSYIIAKKTIQWILETISMLKLCQKLQHQHMHHLFSALRVSHPINTVHSNIKYRDAPLQYVNSRCSMRCPPDPDAPTTSFHIPSFFWWLIHWFLQDFLVFPLGSQFRDQFCAIKAKEPWLDSESRWEILWWFIL